MQDRRLHVVDVDRVGRDVPAEVVGRAVDRAPLHAAAGQPPRVRLAEVIATGRCRRRTLSERRPPELAAPDDERVVEQAAILQVLHEGRARGIRVAALPLELREQVAVLVPARVHELHEADAPLKQPPGDEAVVRIRSLHENIGAVAGENVARLVREVDELGNARLHPERHLVLSDARVDLRIAHVDGVGRIHGCEIVEQGPPRTARDAGGIREIRNEVAGVAEANPLEPARQKAAPPVVVEEELPARLAPVARCHDDERRQIVRHPPEPVRQPRPHARPARHLGPRHEQRHARRVIHRLRVHRPHEADVVRDRPDVRQHRAHREPRAAVAPVRLDRRHAGPAGVAGRHRRQSRRAADRSRDVAARHLAQHRLVVEEIDMRRPAPLPHHDDALRLRNMMRQPGQGVAAGRSRIEERRKGGEADASHRGAEKLPAIRAKQIVHHRIIPESTIRRG